MEDSSPESYKESELHSDEPVDSINWSCSNITAASDFKPYIQDSHLWSTPAGLDSMKERPGSFVKLSFEEIGEEEDGCIEEEASLRRFSTALEKDKKFEKMLSARKNLEAFHQLKSKSPRKLSASSDYGSGRTSSEDRSMTILQTSSSSSSNNKNSTTITSSSASSNPHPERMLEDEVRELRESKEALHLRLRRLELDLQEKDSIIRKLEERSSMELGNLNQRLTMTLGEVNVLKTHKCGLEKKVSAYEIELEKALSLASDFKGKIEEDEEQRDKIIQEFVDQRTLSSQELTEERKKVVELTKEKNALIHDLKTKHSHFSKELTELTNRLQEEKNELTLKLRGLESDNAKLKEDISKSEGTIHEFYQKQMESILSEKLKQLRSYIEELEKNMREENNKIIGDLRQEHKEQISALKEKYTIELRKLMSGFDSERLSFRSTLEAARLEADSLRDQIRTRSQEDSTSLSHNNCLEDSSLSSGLQAISSSRALLQKIQNNTPAAAQDEALTRHYSSSARSSPVLNNNNNRYLHPTSSFTEDDASLISDTEKEDIIKSYIGKYIRENPDALSDTSLMTKLNELLYNIVSKKK